MSININKATVQDVQTLGFSLEWAKYIIDYREFLRSSNQKGFTSVSDLNEIELTPEDLNKLATNVTFNDDTQISSSSVSDNSRSLLENINNALRESETNINLSSGNISTPSNSNIGTLDNVYTFLNINSPDFNSYILKGIISSNTANAIIEYRNQSGYFYSILQVMDLPISEADKVNLLKIGIIDENLMLGSDHINNFLDSEFILPSDYKPYVIFDSGFNSDNLLASNDSSFQVETYGTDKAPGRVKPKHLIEWMKLILQIELAEGGIKYDEKFLMKDLAKWIQSDNDFIIEIIRQMCAASLHDMTGDMLKATKKIFQNLNHMYMSYRIMDTAATNIKDSFFIPILRLESTSNGLYLFKKYLLRIYCNVLHVCARQRTDIQQGDRALYLADVLQSDPINIVYNDINEFSLKGGCILYSFGYIIQWHSRFEHVIGNIIANNCCWLISQIKMTPDYMRYSRVLGYMMAALRVAINNVEQEAEDQTRRGALIVNFTLKAISKLTGFPGIETAGESFISLISENEIQMTNAKYERVWENWSNIPLLILQDSNFKFDLVTLSIEEMKKGYEQGMLVYEKQVFN